MNNTKIKHFAPCSTLVTVKLLIILFSLLQIQLTQLSIIMEPFRGLALNNLGNSCYGNAGANFTLAGRGYGNRVRNNVSLIIEYFDVLK